MNYSSSFKKKSSKKKNCNESSNGTRDESSNGVSLLSLWKIEGRQQAVEGAAGDKMSPSKNVNFPPKVLENVKSDSSSGVQQPGLEYCPNCQMPFSSLVKQSINKHLDDCLDFCFHRMKECPLGDTCSSTVTSHYMRYTHYALARVRSETSPSLKNSSPESINSPRSSKKLKQETFTSPFQLNDSSPKLPATSVTQTISPKYNQAVSLTTSGDAVQCCTNQNRSLSGDKSMGLNASPKSPVSKAKENVSPNCCTNQSKFLNAAPQHSDQTENANRSSSSASCSRKFKSLVESDCDENFQEFEIPHSASVTSLKTFSPPLMRKVCTRTPEYSSENLSSILHKSLSLSEASANLISTNKNLINSENRNERGNGFDFASPALKKRRDDSPLCNISSSGDANDSKTQKNAVDICALAEDFFPLDSQGADSVTASTRNVSNCDNEDELFILKDACDMNKKKMVQTVISKTSHNGSCSFNIALSPVKLSTPSPRKRKMGILPSKSPNRLVNPELNVKPKKRQSSLMSFFKSTSSQAEVNTPKLEFVETPNLVKMKPNKWENDSGKGGSFSSKQEARCNGVRPVRKCPFYKKIPDTTFCVDAFRYGSIPGIRHYFLSHFHYDHYGGLTQSFQHPIYCSVVTANLVSLKIKLPLKFIHILKLNEAVVIDSIEVTALDANHCPGSVMFLFGFPDGRYILHTGDFRATPAMELYPSLQNRTIERLYLDTTYCNPQYDFPSQDNILKLITSVIVPRMKSSVKVLVACGSYTIGKERAFMAIADCIDCKIWAHKPKQAILNCLEDQDISSRLVTDAHKAKIHVLPMQMIRISTLQEYLSKFRGTFDEIIGLKPTGWEHNSNGSNVLCLKPISQGSVTIYGVPYSEHSSFSELKKFVQFLRPRFVLPTVNVGNVSSRAQMKACFEQWHL